MASKLNGKLDRVVFHLSICDGFYREEFHGNPHGQSSMKNAELVEDIIRWYNSIRVFAWDWLTVSV